MGTVVLDGGVWKCSRRDRAFVATAVDAMGVPQRSAFTVRTPSCANRLTLRTAPGRATVSDSFGLGGVHARVCARACRRVTVPADAAGVTVPVRGPRVVLRTGYQRVVQRVGRQPSGGPVVLSTGDSLMQNLDVILQDRLKRSADVRSDIKYGGSLGYEAIYGPWAAIARGQVARLHPRATVVFLGSNDTYAIGDAPCCGPAWGAAYERLAHAAMEIYAQGGAGAVAWLTVPYPRDPERRPAVQAVNAALHRAAVGLPTVAVVPADELIPDDPAYREPDGIHLSLRGSRVVAPAVLAALRKLGAL